MTGYLVGLSKSKSAKFWTQPVRVLKCAETSKYTIVCMVQILGNFL